jgi:molecular chaperone DnaJ
MGTEIMVPTMEGDYKLKVPEGTQSGTSFRIRSHGVPVLNGRGKGDLFVEVRVQTPGKLTKRQRELLAELGQLSPVENKPQRRSLLGRVKDMFA